jgi:hypothetical protein
MGVGGRTDFFKLAGSVVIGVAGGYCGAGQDWSGAVCRDDPFREVRHDAGRVSRLRPAAAPHGMVGSCR